MLVTVLVLGVFIPVVQATTGAANEVRGRVLVDVYLKRDATKPRRRARPRAARARHAGRRQRPVRLQGSRPTPQREEAQPARSTSCSARTRCPTRSASRPTTRTTCGKIRDALAPHGRRRRARRRRVDRRGQEPQGRHAQDPLRHARGEARRWAARGAAGRSPRCC